MEDLKLHFEMHDNIKERWFECTLHDGVSELRRRFDRHEMARMFWTHDIDHTPEQDVKVWHDRVRALAERHMRKEWEELVHKHRNN